MLRLLLHLFHDVVGKFDRRVAYRGYALLFRNWFKQHAVAVQLYRLSERYLTTGTGTGTGAGAIYVAVVTTEGHG